MCHRIAPPTRPPAPGRPPLRAAGRPGARGGREGQGRGASSSSAPRDYGLLLLLGGLVRREDPVQPPARLGEELHGAPALLGGARRDDLHRRGAELHHQVAQLAGFLREAAADGLPGLAELLATRLDVLAARVGESEHAAGAFLRRLDKALVLELGERGVDRAGARAPDSLAALLDLLHERVAVARLLGKEQQDGGADVAARCAAAAGAEGRAEAGAEARAEATRPEGTVAVVAVAAHASAPLLPRGGTVPLMWICHGGHGGPFVRCIDDTERYIVNSRLSTLAPATRVEPAAVALRRSPPGPRRRCASQAPLGRQALARRAARRGALDQERR